MGLVSIGPRIRTGTNHALVVAVAVSLVLFAATVAAQKSRYLNLDVAWYAYAATHLDLGSCRLYVDCFVDTNPPFALWFIAAMARAGALLGLDPVASIRIAVAALSLATGALLYSAFRAVLRRGGALPLALASGYLAIVGIVSIGDYAQREHVIALLVASYVVSLPLAAEAIGLELALASGVLAGLAVAIKPYYALLPLACELWVVWRASSLRPILRPQAIALAATVAASFVALVLWAPGYLSLARVIASAYPAYQEGLSALLQIDRVTIAVLVLPLVAWIAARSPDGCAPALPLCVAAAAAALVYFFQRMGFSYQGIPALALILLAAYCTSLRLFAADPRWRVATLCASGCVLLIVFSIAGRLVARHGAEALAMLAGSARSEAASGAAADDTDVVASYGQETAWMIAAIRRHAGTGDIGYLSTSIDPLFPALLYTDANLADRMPHLWLLPALTENGGIDNVTRARLRGLLLDTLRQDLAKRPPRLIIEVRGRVQGVDGDGFSPARFLSADPALHHVLLAYREVDRMRRGGREVVFYRVEP
jgi:hypothetical protein